MSGSQVVPVFTEWKDSPLQKHGNPSLQCTVDHRIKLVQAPIVKPEKGQVLVHVKATGICGSDVHFWKHGQIGDMTLKGDCILGHEAAGIVVALGEGVTNLAVGDRVAIEPGVSCLQCFLCKAGNYNLCPEVAFASVWPFSGTLQRFMLHPSKWLHKLPANVTFAQGALVEPLSVVLHGVRRAPLTFARPVLVCGAGPIGLVALAVARASGAHPIVITDLEPGRLEFAKKFVPQCRTFQIRRDQAPADAAQDIRRLFRLEQPKDAGAPKEEEPLEEYFAPTTVLECTGVESSVVTACYTVRRSGTVMVIGVGRSIMNNIPFMHLSLAEIDLKFMNRYTDTWPAGIAALESGLLNLDPLVTHSFPLEKAMEAIELVADPSKGSIKVHIVDDTDVAL